MTAPSELRLLPWVGPGGKPCYLSTDDRGGYLSRLADDIEAAQLGLAAELLEQVPDTLDDVDAEPDEIRNVGRELTSVLRDVLRVAISRGHLLAVSDPRPNGCRRSSSATVERPRTAQERPSVAACG
ncbi:hypothetical protein [Streptomyces sp. DT195]|uniref:hypothetical protein n=1 Tax=Streptomyces sp. DT195 TaxID=3393419 RepID=UPI003CF827EB